MARKEKKSKKAIEADKKAALKPKKVDRTILTTFLFIMPLLIIAYTTDFFTKVLLFFYEAVLLYNFIRDKSPEQESNEIIS